MSTNIGIGLMSGTSGDGVDSALVDFTAGGIKLLATGFTPYSAKIRNEILKASSPAGPAELICRLNAELGKIFGRAALDLCRAAKFPARKINFIGSHGQTIRHQPLDGGVSSTLQIGDGSEIVRLAGAWVVSDFRTADVAAGGSGAPLAPLAHYVLFSSSEEDRVVHNLGGVGNVTWLPAGKGLRGVNGFDTGPANMLMDQAAVKFSRGRARYDRDGAMALRGKVDRKMFDHCMGHPFYKRKPPKSTGREEFGKEYFDGLIKRFGKLAKEDFMRTLAAVTAESAVRQVFGFLGPKKGVRWILCGGGAFNRAVTAELSARLGARGRVVGSSAFGYGEKNVEAVMMAALAYRTLNGLHGNIPRVTGAKVPAVLGKISIP